MKLTDFLDTNPSSKYLKKYKEYSEYKNIFFKFSIDNKKIKSTVYGLDFLSTDYFDTVTEADKSVKFNIELYLKYCEDRLVNPEMPIPKESRFRHFKFSYSSYFLREQETMNLNDAFYCFGYKQFLIRMFSNNLILYKKYECNKHKISNFFIRNEKRKINERIIFIYGISNVQSVKFINQSIENLFFVDPNNSNDIMKIEYDSSRIEYGKRYQFECYNDGLFVNIGYLTITNDRHIDICEFSFSLNFFPKEKFIGCAAIIEDFKSLDSIFSNGVIKINAGAFQCFKHDFSVFLRFFTELEPDDDSIKLFIKNYFNNIDFLTYCYQFVILVSEICNPLSEKFNFSTYKFYKNRNVLKNERSDGEKYEIIAKAKKIVIKENIDSDDFAILICFLNIFDSKESIREIVKEGFYLSAAIKCFLYIGNKYVECNNYCQIAIYKFEGCTDFQIFDKIKEFSDQKNLSMHDYFGLNARNPYVNNKAQFINRLFNFEVKNLALKFNIPLFILKKKS
jgi:hypothetical protein